MGVGSLKPLASTCLITSFRKPKSANEWVGMYASGASPCARFLFIYCETLKPGFDFGAALFPRYPKPPIWGLLLLPLNRPLWPYVLYEEFITGRVCAGNSASHDFRTLHVFKYF